MANVLTNHAIVNVWCAPDLDRQVMLEPARIGPPSGVISRVEVNWETLQLPEPEIRGQWWHVYTLGNLPSTIYNLPDVDNTWQYLPDVCQAQNLFIQCYNLSGLSYPLSTGYIRRIYDGTYVLALRATNKVAINFDEPLFVRLYSNAYFDSDAWTGGVNSSLPGIKVHGGLIGKDFDVTSWVGYLQTIPSPTIGHTFVWRNGFITAYSSIQDFVVGDYVEAVTDRSVMGIFQWDYADVDSFTSILDAAEKKILYPVSKGSDGGPDAGIHYKDDVDFYVTRASIVKPTKPEGVYYHQNDDSSIRMLTHNSYATKNLQMNDLFATWPWLEAGNADATHAADAICYVTAIVRYSGIERNLVNEKNRINQLYRLPLANIRAAMSGLNSLIPEWRAENLEQCGYIRLMDTPKADINDDLVADAYGYNATTQVAYPPMYPVKTAGTSRYVEKQGEFVPSSLFVYDTNGYLVGAQGNNGGESIPLTIANSHLAKNVELLDMGLSAGSGRTFYGSTSVTAPEGLDRTGYRCYVCTVVDGFPNEVWRDVTGDNNYYEVSGDGKTVLWKSGTLTTTQEYPATRLGGITWFQGQIPFVAGYSGALEFSMSTVNPWQYPTITDASVNVYRPDSVAYGQIEVYMGTSPYQLSTLVPGIDYYVKWPKVVITKAINQTPDNGLVIAVRANGFCRSDMSMYEPRDSGWVQDGLVSANGRWDTRNDRNFKVIVGGQFKLPTQVRFSEDATTGSLQPNGAPYAIVDIIQEVDALLARDTMAFRDEAIEIDERVENYISTVDPGTPPASVFPLAQLYKLYDPFLSRLLHLLKDGFLDGQLDGYYDMSQVETWCEPFTYLLDFDPILNNVSETYATVLPHQYDDPVSVTLAQYRFLDRVNTNYLGGKIPLSPYLTVVEE